MDGRDGNTSDTNIIDILFDGRAYIYLSVSYASVEVMELINMGIHE